VAYSVLSGIYNFFRIIIIYHESRLCVLLQVSAWGGYVFIINLVPLHVFVLLLMGRFSSRIYVGELVYLLKTVRSSYCKLTFKANLYDSTKARNLFPEPIRIQPTLDVYIQLEYFLISNTFNYSCCTVFTLCGHVYNNSTLFSEYPAYI